MLRIYRFEKVVDGIHREGLQRVPVVGCGENHDRLARQTGQDLETVQPRHLNVEKTHVRRIRREGGDGFLRLGGTPGYLDAFRLRQQTRQTLQGERFVIHQVGAQLHTRGKTIWTTHRPSRRRIFRCAREPNKVSSRSTRLSKPCPARMAAESKPGPLSDTSMQTRPFSADALTNSPPPPFCGVIPCFTAFSTSD